MTADEVRKRLEHVRKVRNEIDRLEEQREQLCSGMTSISHRMDATGVHASRYKDRFAEYVARVDKLDHEIAARVQIIRQAAQVAYKYIHVIDPLQWSVIHGRFIAGWTWPHVADSVGIGRSYAIRLCKAGIQAVADTNIEKLKP